jgi:hypothetical protein
MLLMETVLIFACLLATVVFMIAGIIHANLAYNHAKRTTSEAAFLFVLLFLPASKIPEHVELEGWAHLKRARLCLYIFLGLVVLWFVYVVFDVTHIKDSH